jgi:hypothetical protein
MAVSFNIISQILLANSRIIPHYICLLGVPGDRRCGLVVRVPGYRFGGSGSIPGATNFSEKQWVWNGVHSAS